MGENRKKFKLTTAILAVICVVFVAEAAAPVAAIGNSQYFWWIFMMIAFLLPYGLIAAELGTTYDGEGGIYDWISKAYGRRMGSRTAWYYWVNFPLWMASLAVLFPEIIGKLAGVQISAWLSILIELAFIWIVVVISFYPISDSTWILNTSACIKLILAIAVGGLGIYTALTKGVANEYTLSSLLPSFDLRSLSFISVIIFNFLGFEVICTYAPDMQNPKKQIPQAIIAGGIVIALIYIFSAFGIGVAIPTDEISTSSGLIDSFQLLLGSSGGILLIIVSVLFLLTLFGNMISWSFGVNSVAAYAADNGDLPKYFGKRSGKNNMPTGAAVMNGLLASAIVIIGALLPESDLFWSFFALNLVMLLVSYVVMFPAFLKLRKIDGDTERPFRVPGGSGMLRVITYVPMILLIISIIFTAVPFSLDYETLTEVLPITVGTIVSLIIGEIIIHALKIPKKSGR